MNLTNQCNLSCQYCYEFGADKVATPEGKPKFMDLETAKASVDFLLAQSAGRRSVHITFFGGETLMNFPLLKQVVAYANERAAAQGRHIDFSLTTNATLLTPAIIEFLSENRIGVTVSMDGPKEMHDQLRVFANGSGSYDIIEPRVRALIQNHRTRPITARVTLTSGVTDVVRIFRHLKQDLGFHEVGFAPVTTSPNQLYAINEQRHGRRAGTVPRAGRRVSGVRSARRMHGFSNVSDTLAELCQGVNKSHPCGAGLGLLGVGPSGDIAPCHRFVDSDAHALGHISTGIDREKQADFLRRGHIDSKYDCHTCWARPLCAGGCHHEAFVRYGDTGHPNLHYCDWIRDWTDTCLKIYGAIGAKNPGFLATVCRKESIMKHLRASEQESARASTTYVAVAHRGRRGACRIRPAQPQRPHVPMGCALMFSPGWEVDAAGGTAGLCQPVERDIYDCYVSCYWPAQVPDHLNNAPDWTSQVRRGHQGLAQSGSGVSISHEHSKADSAAASLRGVHRVCERGHALSAGYPGRSAGLRRGQSARSSTGFRWRPARPCPFGCRRITRRSTSPPTTTTASK